MSNPYGPAGGSKELCPSCSNSVNFCTCTRQTAPIQPNQPQGKVVREHFAELIEDNFFWDNPNGTDITEELNTFLTAYDAVCKELEIADESWKRVTEAVAKERDALAVDLEACKSELSQASADYQDLGRLCAEDGKRIAELEAERDENEQVHKLDAMVTELQQTIATVSKAFYDADTEAKELRLQNISYLGQVQTALERVAELESQYNTQLKYHTLERERLEAKLKSVLPCFCKQIT